MSAGITAMPTDASQTGQDPASKKGQAVSADQSGYREKRDGAARYRAISAGGVRWQVRSSEAETTLPKLLLIHGTGAGIHSWNAIWPALEPHFQLLAPDLPGHCGSQAPPNWRPSLPAMTDALHALLTAVPFAPDLVVGHSAGAALAASLTLNKRIAPRALIAINGAFMPYGGAAASLMMPVARWCADSRLITRTLARRAAQDGAVERLLEQTGSQVGREAVRRYQPHLKNPEHVAGTLRMMANWDLRPLLSALPSLASPLYLLVGDSDTTVPPRQARQLGQRMTLAGTRVLPDLGHLAHEEQPERVAEELLDIAGLQNLIDNQGEH